MTPNPLTPHRRHVIIDLLLAPVWGAAFVIALPFIGIVLVVLILIDRFWRMVSRVR